MGDGSKVFRRNQSNSSCSTAKTLGFRPGARLAMGAEDAFQSGDDRAQLVGVQEVRAGAVQRPALVLQDRLVRSRSPVEPPAHAEGVAVVLRHDMLAVVEELGLAEHRAGGLVKPPQRIVGQGGPARGRGAHQLVLGVVRVAVGPVAGQVAVGVGRATKWQRMSETSREYCSYPHVFPYLRQSGGRSPCDRQMRRCPQLPRAWGSNLFGWRSFKGWGTPHDGGQITG